jgi:hypothetical protein
MDTRFWGPSGWRLLHTIAAGKAANQNRTFWEMLPYVLPCKFCRHSLSIYYEELPIPSSAEKYDTWLFKIHNKVNDKLRKQGQTLPPDPSLKSVLDHYDSVLQQGCTKTSFPGWSFLFAIADNHPYAAPSAPMPDTPIPNPTSLKERNQYNLLTPAERKEALRSFWQSIPDVLPFEEWRTSWKKHAGSLSKAVKNRTSALRWLWRIRCGMDADLHQIGDKNFYGLCKEVANHRSGCSTNKRAKTCRKLRPVQRKTRRHKQR